MLARLAQGVGELFVLGDGLCELALALQEALLERAHALGRVLELAAQPHHVLFEHLHLLLEVGDLVLVLAEPVLVLRVGRGAHLRLTSLPPC